MKKGGPMGVAALFAYDPFCMVREKEKEETEGPEGRGKE